MTHIRQMLTKPLQLKVISTLHSVFWKLVDFCIRKMIN